MKRRRQHKTCDNEGSGVVGRKGGAQKGGERCSRPMLPKQGVEIVQIAQGTREKSLYPCSGIRWGRGERLRPTIRNTNEKVGDNQGSSTRCSVCPSCGQLWVTKGRERCELEKGGLTGQKRDVTDVKRGESTHQKEMRKITHSQRGRLWTKDLETKPVARLKKKIRQPEHSIS